MQPVFDAAPILMVRGNHESCARGGIGFFLFFSPQRSTALQCAPSIVDGVVVVPSNDITPTWNVIWQVGTSDEDSRSLTLEVVDSAYGQDDVVDAFHAVLRPVAGDDLAFPEPNDIGGPTGPSVWVLPVASHDDDSIFDGFHVDQGNVFTRFE